MTKSAHLAATMAAPTTPATETVKKQTGAGGKTHSMMTAMSQTKLLGLQIGGIGFQTRQHHLKAPRQLGGDIGGDISTAAGIIGGHVRGGDIFAS